MSGGAGRSSSTTSPARGNNIPADQFQLVAGKKRRDKKRRVDDAAARGAVETSGVPVAAAGGGAEVGGGDTASRTTHSDSEELMVGLSSDLGDSGEEVVPTASTSREGTATIESTSQEGTAKVGTAPSPCPAEASTSGTAGATTGRKRKTEAGPTPPKSKRKKAKIPPGSTFEQAEKDNLLGVILRQDNPYKLLTRIQIDWIRNELLKLLEATVTRQDGSVPCFQESGKQKGRFHLSCFDLASYEWVENAVSSRDTDQSGVDT